MPHRQHRHCLALTCAAALFVLPWTVSADDEARATHKHYEDTPEAALPGPHGELAPRLQNLGNHTFPVSTRDAAAQRFIDQGLKLAYAFNHGEARRAFREAARLDPDLAMAWWGQALVLGPNINAAMQPNEEPNARQMIEEAQKRAAGASEREQDLIAALARRYSGDSTARKANDQAYAEAMRAVHAKYPQDDDIAILYVESMMDLRPWGYWMPDGRPHEHTADIVALTERVLARNPRHPGALHLHIHLLEPTPTPERAERSADTLLRLMPAAGHLVHMPSHIYQRVGRYGDAIEANRLAVAADEDYLSQCRAQGLYPMIYYPHNIHFLWFAAMFDGQRDLATDAAERVAGKIDDDALAAMPMLAGFRVLPWWTMLRFGEWNALLAAPAPGNTSAYLRAAWHYVRGQALVATGKVDLALAELRALEEVLAGPGLDHTMLSPNTAGEVMAIGVPSLAGEIAAAEGRWDDAVAALEHAVRLEDALDYTEPTEWAYPPRHALGSVLLAAGRAAEAETVFWLDLREHRDNGWALSGLAEALRAQGRAAEVALVEQRLARAWPRAEVHLKAARLGAALADRGAP